MKMQQELLEKDRKYIWHPCSQMKDYEELPPIIIERGKGLYLYDENGKAYADTVSSWWCNLLGHSNERINNAVKKQLDCLEHVIFANFTHRPAITLCEELAKVLPKGLGKFFFTDNGSSAIEAAMKMSFQYHYQSGSPQKTKFMALTEAYHGETLGALSVGGVDLYSSMYKPILLEINRIESPDCYRCKYGKQRSSCCAPCFEAAEKVFAEHGNETTAMLVEPLFQGAAGMKIYPPIYLKKLRKLCDDYGVHLIADEIATGYGRTGKMFACDHAEISPDIICLSKGLTGGYMPMALAVTTDKIYDAFYGDYSEGKAFMHSHTYSGNPLACSAAIEVLKILKDEDIIEKANENAVYFTKLIKQRLSGHKNVGDIRSIGLVNAIELVKDRNTKEPLDSKDRTGYQIYKKALEKGLILRPLGDVLYFNPPLIIQKEDMDKVVAICLESLVAILGE
ncbi:MAG: adenosylmethionine--8-amino-7-oxononanoate transaminase [Proteocatella sp.]